MKLVPVILSGGSGTRLWPLSREDYPKQYIPLVSDNSMLQETIMRLNGLDDLLDPIIICNSSHRFIVAEQCRQIGVINPTILLEPIGRNTAPAITAAAIQSLKDYDNSILLVLSADHLIQDKHAFHKALNIAKGHVIKGSLAIFGVFPTSANTGYGYINISKKDYDGAFKVNKFIEKPDLKTAEFIIEEGDYFWNSGMFMFQADDFINELSMYHPEIVKFVSQSVSNSKEDLDFIRLEENAFELSPSISIDYALMEKSNNVIVVPMDADWKDIGSWEALYDISEKDCHGNVIKGDAIIHETKNTFIKLDNRMVAVLGVDNLIIVDTPDITFISSRDKVNQIKSFIESIEVNENSKITSNRKIYRPWGWFDKIESGEFFQVKRLHVKSGGKLSLQMHHKRAEHWIVVSGQATVTSGEKTFTLNIGESTFIPLGVQHALENQANDEALEIIEVQSGTYLGEDDIIRFEDIYGRANN